MRTERMIETTKPGIRVPSAMDSTIFSISTAASVLLADAAVAVNAGIGCSLKKKMDGTVPPIYDNIKSVKLKGFS